MQDFRYFAPVTVKDATALLSEHGDRAKILAGGTDVLVQLREGLRHADVVINVKKIPDLMQLELWPQYGLRLGAGVPCWRVNENPGISAAYPALVDATRIIGGWQIQTRASVGGNLCNSSPAADCIAPLIVHNAACHIAGPAGRRTLPVEQFCTGPGRNVLQESEMLVALTVPPPPRRSGSAYQRFIPRNEMDIAVAGVACWVQLDESGRHIEQARIALAAVAPRPVLAEPASSWLAGKPASEEVFAEAGKLAKESTSPITDMRGTAEYRTHLVGVLARRTLAQAADRAKTGTPLVSEPTLGWKAEPRLSDGKEPSSCFQRKIHVSTTINGEEVEFLCEARQSLLEVLRDVLGLTGAKEGCNNGNCGACTVLMDGLPVDSCLVLAVEAEGAEITTVEGIARGGQLHPLQQCFLESAALQCGVCTPGFLVAAKALLDRSPDPSEEEIRFALAGNLCRCTGYDKIVRAVQAAGEALKEAVS